MSNRKFLKSIILSTATNLSILFAAVLLVVHANAQGCAQCLDTTQSTPPAVQTAYRHAIFLLAGAGCTLFAAAIVIFKRNR